MRIAAISDIHVLPDESDKLLLDTIRDRVEEIDPDVFVVAGDISDKLSVLERSLVSLKIESCENLYVAGNHDIWFEENRGLGSLEKYSKAVGEVCKRTGFIHLPDSPYIKEEFGFVGSIGWYDYSFRREDLDIPLENYQHKEYRGAVWYDLFRVDWGFTDKEATDLFNKRLEYDLNTLSQTVKHIVYVSHHLPFQDLTVYKNRLPWDFHSAFMGAKSTGIILNSDSRVKLSISGHSHIRSALVNDTLTSITVPVGYGRPGKNSMSSFVRDAVAEIEIDEKQVKILNFVEGDICAGLSYISSRN
ncbi:MAG: metallophosphoesterase [Promethearchaeota archaeon]